MNSLKFRFPNKMGIIAPVMVFGEYMNNENIHFINIKCKTQWCWQEVK